MYHLNNWLKLKLVLAMRLNNWWNLIKSSTYQWVRHSVSSSQTKNLFLLTPAKMKNYVTIQLHLFTQLIAERFNFILHAQHQFHPWLLVSKYWRDCLKDLLTLFDFQGNPYCKQALYMKIKRLRRYSNPRPLIS